MAVSVDTILDSVSTTLLDTARNAWTRSELLGYLDEAQRTTCFLKPDAYTKLVAVDMVAGVEQELPADGIAVLDVTENVASGLRITLVDRELLDETNRFWPAATSEDDVQHWCADPRDPRRFDVTPPNAGGGQVRVLYGAVPSALTDSSGETIALVDTYQYTLECFVLYKALSKNSKRQDLVKAAAYMNEFRVSLGLKSQAQVAVAPKVSVSEGSR